MQKNIKKCSKFKNNNNFSLVQKFNNELVEMNV